MPANARTELSSLAEWLPLTMCNAYSALGEPKPSYKQTNIKINPSGTLIQQKVVKKVHWCVFLATFNIEGQAFILKNLAP